ncbi:MAG: anti-sigma regulatory factor [Thermoanaerobaculaceae bacterium]|jgi:serine/threonine-protein kinase RsbT
MKDRQQGEFRIESESDIVSARKIIRNAAVCLGFGLTDVTRIVTAASELTRNIYVHARSGVMRWRTVNNGPDVGLEVTFEDRGPGIPDLAKAMEVGFSTGSGLGMGLPGSKRLTDEMTISSEVGKGTTVVVRKWLKS